MSHTRINHAREALAGEFRGSPVGPSEDLTRILALPRRQPPRCTACLREREEAKRLFESGGDMVLVRCRVCYDSGISPELAAKWTEILRKPDAPCDCEERFPLGCIKSLRPVQGWVLEELHTYGHCAGLVGTGHGKTGIATLAPMVRLKAGEKAMVLLQPNLREQFLRDHHQWSVHFKVPNLAGGRHLEVGRPVLYVVAYSELSGQKASDLLTRIVPKLVIADEAHNLASAGQNGGRRSARGDRFQRLFQVHPSTEFLPLSGTLTKKSLTDYAHLLGFALKESSPAPRWYQTAEEWGAALDAGEFRAPPGHLRKLCSDGEDVRSGFRRRLIETPGVVATEEGAVGCSLIISEHRLSRHVPEPVKALVQQVELEWLRPDGEELVDPIRKTEVIRQLASGFFYKWRWPKQIDQDFKERWLAARKAWRRELREKLKSPVEMMDSEGLCSKAAARWHRGYEIIDEEKGTRTVVPPFTKDGPLPIWRSVFWPEWIEVATEFERRTGLKEPETVEVWVDDFLVQECAEWARKHVGIVWYDHRVFGPAVAQAAGVPCYGGGEEASTNILNERGRRSIIASIDAHGTGKNLQMFHRNLVAQPPGDGGVWEQMMARTHRPGQKADAVEVEVMQHMASERAALRKAYRRALYQYETTGNPQKLLYASWTFNVAERLETLTASEE